MEDKRMDQKAALTFSEFGKPLEVLKLTESSPADLGEGDLRLRMLAAPIHPSDMGILLGKYGSLPELPAVAGREGVGEIVELGPGVENGLAVGDRVAVAGGPGTWQQSLVAPAGKCIKIPEDLPDEMAAMVTINPPTAWRVLRDAHLNDGEWVVQNAANSAVGLHVIEMAHHLGLKTLNVVRREALIEPLKARGGDVVVLEDSGYEKQVRELTGGGQVKLALNSVGGESALRLVKALSRDGLHITFGAMAFEAVRLPTRQFIFDGLTMKGFWMDRWLRENNQARTQIMFDKIFDLMQRGIVRAPVEKMYPLKDFQEALAAAAQPRLGKILFRCDA